MSETQWNTKAFDGDGVVVGLVPQDVEVPLHLLRYVCLFCGKHGLSLMKECFESGTPESLPFPIAHAFITIVSNVSPGSCVSLLCTLEQGV